MDSLLEQQRQLHEDIEFLEKSMADEMLQVHVTHKEKVNSEHRVRRMMEKIHEKSKQARAIYDDKDGFRGEELESLTSSNPLREFNARLATLRDYHRRNPNMKTEPLKLDILAESASALGTIHLENFLEHLAESDLAKAQGDAASKAMTTNLLPNKYVAPVPEQSNLSAVDFRVVAEQPMLAEFADEEGFGKFLDLHFAHNLYINLKGVIANDYITYLASFDNFAEMPKKYKSQALYKDYLQKLCTYLEGFIDRAMPLMNLQKELQRIDEEFETDWAAGSMPGWSKADGEEMEVDSDAIDLSNFQSLEELKAADPAKLKAALTSLGLKCGGTPAQRAERLWATKGKQRDQLDKSFFVSAQKKDSAEANKILAHLEHRIMNLLVLLKAVRLQTREHVELRMSRSAHEMVDDDVGDVLEAVLADDDIAPSSNEIPYNPKGLPLGWDGNPMPYWLYKLHGLNVKYKCEICGNQTYLGPKAFAKHFQEWKHAAGMRALKIPNTAHFAFVTEIEDAKNLWEKLKQDKSVEAFQAQMEEEFEDTQGNVVDKKTYDLLQKQGLL